MLGSVVVRVTAKRSTSIDFFFDPVCPFAWMTSRWVVQVAGLRDVDVTWRFIALRIVNADKDYGSDFPDGYETLHTAGLRLLRVAAAVRADHGNGSVGELYRVVGESLWDREPDPGGLLRRDAATPPHLVEVLEAAGLDPALAAAADDETHDEIISAETELALSRAGRDVGTPIITFSPPDGSSFFGPVISRLPGDDEAVALWEAVETLAGFAPFAELKRSLRYMPDLPALRGFGT